MLAYNAHYSRVQTQAVLPRVRSEERSEEACSEERSEEGLSSAHLNGVVLSSSDLNSANLPLAFSRSNVLTRPTGQRKMPVWTRQRSVLRVSMTLRPYKAYGVSLQPNRYKYWCKLLCILNLCGVASCSSNPQKAWKGEYYWIVEWKIVLLWKTVSLIIMVVKCWSSWYFQIRCRFSMFREITIMASHDIGRKIVL